MIRIGTAAWSVPRAVASEFPGEGTHLQRYARVLECAEINSSFYREHSAATYAKWASMTPPGFRFSVKLPQSITHELALRRARSPLETFLRQTAGLGKKRGPLLVQLPPSLAFEPRTAQAFFRLIRKMHPGAIVCEPRHASWFGERAETALLEYCIGRVAADPAMLPTAARPAGWMRKTAYVRATAYYRWHGSPRKYWSRYPREWIEQKVREICSHPARTEVWCIFDNTASGAAIENALQMQNAIAASAQKGARHEPAS